MPISEKLKSNKFLYKFAINFGILLFYLFYRFFLSQKSRKIESPYSKMFLKIFNLSTCNYLKKNANFDFQVACTITMIEKKNNNFVNSNQVTLVLAPKNTLYAKYNFSMADGSWNQFVRKYFGLKLTLTRIQWYYALLNSQCFCTLIIQTHNKNINQVRTSSVLLCLLSRSLKKERNSIYARTNTHTKGMNEWNESFKLACKLGELDPTLAHCHDIECFLVVVVVCKYIT